MYLQDVSLITEQPCGPPCWRGITPGETSWNDAIAIIENDDTLYNLEIRSDEATGQIGATWDQVDGRNCCQMFSQDGETVSLIVTQTAPLFSLGVVLEKFGEPQYLIGAPVTDDQALVSIYYPNKNMLIYLFAAGEDGIISEQNDVVGFAYTSTDVMNLIIQTSDLYAWRGTGQTLGDYLESPWDVTPSVTLTPVGTGQ